MGPGAHAMTAAANPLDDPEIRCWEEATEAARLAAVPPYGPRPVNGRRRTRAEIEALEALLWELVEGGRPMTVRQVFYRAEVAGAVDKTEAGYKCVKLRLAEMRRRGSLPYDWITDGTRWMRKPASWGSAADMLDEQMRLFRLDLWGAQDAYVEVWCEKDALTGVLYPVTSAWDVPLMPGRGYASLSFLHSAAEAMEAQRKPCFVYYLGDHDPSGCNAGEVTEARLREFAPAADIAFEWLAVTPEQIETYDLPTRPTKTSDSRAAGFGDRSVELDAIPPRALRDLVEAAIERHIDPDRLAALQQEEALQRESLAAFTAGFEGDLEPDSGGWRADGDGGAG